MSGSILFPTSLGAAAIKTFAQSWSIFGLWESNNLAPAIALASNSSKKDLDLNR